MTLKKRNGYTLIELLLFIAISSIFLAATAQLLQSAVDFKLETSGSAAVDLAGNYLYARLRYDIRRASSISLPAGANQTGDTLRLVIGGVSYTYTVSSGRLILSTPTLTAPVSDNTVIVQNFSVTRTGVSPQSTGAQIRFDLESQDKTTGNIIQRRSWQFTTVMR